MADQHPTIVAASLSSAMGVLFGVPLGTPVDIRLQFTNRWQLREANGFCPRVAKPIEIQSALIATFSVLRALLELDIIAFNPAHAPVVN